MNNKYFWLALVAMAILIVALAAVLFWPVHKEAVVELPQPTPPADIEVFSLKPNDIVPSPLIITGIVRGNGWAGFEGQVGTVHVMDAGNTELAVGILTATTPWMQLPTSFQVTVTFAGVSGQPGSLVFKNENPSGDPIRDKTFTLPIIFQ